MNRELCKPERQTRQIEPVCRVRDSWPVADSIRIIESATGHESRTLQTGSICRVCRSGLQSSRFMARCGLNDPDCLSAARHNCYEAAVPIEINHSGAYESVATRF